MLKAHLQQRGVRMIVGLSALKPLAEPKMLQGVSLGDAKNSPAYRAKAFVLATGKFVGGGLDSERGRIYETLLDLPVLHSRNRKEWFNLRFLTTEGHPFNVFGVEVDENLQPTGPGGQVIYSNLFAAGGIIAHADSISEKSGGGIAISTGFLAGKLAGAMK
jgi:glycerol-3-phosphate dehydrogenase subunit B